jgi:hypothetical protein
MPFIQMSGMQHLKECCFERFFLLCFFNSVIPMFATRSCNEVAHRLAQFGAALQNVLGVFWLENFLAIVTDSVASDLELWLMEVAIPVQKR